MARKSENTENPSAHARESEEISFVLIPKETYAVVRKKRIKSKRILKTLCIKPKCSYDK